jgi:hypothetical protein
MSTSSGRPHTDRPRSRCLTKPVAHRRTRLAGLTQATRTTTDACGPPQRAARIATFLSALDPDTLPAHRTVIAAALRHLPTADPRARLRWAAYLDRALRDVYGAHHPAALHAQAAYGAVLAGHGRTTTAVAVFTDHLAATRRAGNPALQVDAYRHLAGALHESGHCRCARRNMQHAVHSWHQTHGAQAQGIAILTNYTAILAGCGHTSAAVALLRRYPDLLPATGADIADAAHHIALVEHTHPADCRDQPGRLTSSDAALEHRAHAWQHAICAHQRPATPGGAPPESTLTGPVLRPSSRRADLAAAHAAHRAAVPGPGLPTPGEMADPANSATRPQADGAGQ